MGREEVTARDIVWAAVIKEYKLNTRFGVQDIRSRIPPEDRPSDETIRRVLRSGTTLGVIDHGKGTERYQLKI